MKRILNIWPIALFVIGLFFLLQNETESSIFNDSKKSTSKFKLTIPQASQELLNEQLRTFPNINKKYVEASVEFNGQVIPVQIKFHGTSSEHYYDTHQSYKIKIAKSNKFKINGAKKLQLIKCPEGNISSGNANKFAKEHGLIAPVGQIVMAHISGKKERAYYLVEHHTNSFFKNQGYKNSLLLSQTSDWTRKEVWQRNFQHSTPFDFDKEHIEQEDHPQFKEALLAYEKLGIAVKTEDVLCLKEYVDMNYMAKFLTTAELFNEVHFLTGDNLKWLYDFDHKKFYPFYRQESGGKLLPDNQKNNFADFDAHLFKNSLAKYDVAENLQLFKLLLSDDEFRHERNLALNNVIKNKSIREMSMIFLNQNFPTKSELKGVNFAELNDQIEMYERMKSLADQYINYGHVYGAYDTSSKSVSLIVDALCQISIHSVDGNKIMDLNPVVFKSDLSYSTKKINISLEQFGLKNEHDLIFINNVTKKGIPKNRIHINSY